MKSENYKKIVTIELNPSRENRFLAKGPHFLQNNSFKYSPTFIPFLHRT